MFDKLKSLFKSDEADQIENLRNQNNVLEHVIERRFEKLGEAITEVRMHDIRLKELEKEVFDKEVNNKSEYSIVPKDELPEWSTFNEDVETFCPKCRMRNVKKIPTKAQFSMSINCKNCGTLYRLYFNDDEV